jgi:membrane protein insertase Oxa1/YidC/SpoIIIJ
MKMMLYMMMLMMGMFVFTSKAGLGFYWCIGNVYSIVQAAINNKTNKVRMEKLKSKF